jgi:hypothetical protein
VTPVPSNQTLLSSVVGTPASFSEGPCLKSQPESRPVTLTEVFCSFPQQFQENSGMLVQNRSPPIPYTYRCPLFDVIFWHTEGVIKWRNIAKFYVTFTQIKTNYFYVWHLYHSRSMLLACSDIWLHLEYLWVNGLYTLFNFTTRRHKNQVLIAIKCLTATSLNNQHIVNTSARLVLPQERYPLPATSILPYTYCTDSGWIWSFDTKP